MSFTHLNRIPGPMLTAVSDLEKMVLELVHLFFFSSSLFTVDGGSSHTDLHESFCGFLVVDLILIIHFLNLPITRDYIVHQYILASTSYALFCFLTYFLVILLLSIKSIGFYTKPGHFGIKIIHFSLINGISDLVCPNGFFEGFVGIIVFLL